MDNLVRCMLMQILLPMSTGPLHSEPNKAAMDNERSWSWIANVEPSFTTENQHQRWHLSFDSMSHRVGQTTMENSSLPMNKNWSWQVFPASQAATNSKRPKAPSSPVRLDPPSQSGLFGIHNSLPPGVLTMLATRYHRRSLRGVSKYMMRLEYQQLAKEIGFVLVLHEDHTKMFAAMNGWNRGASMKCVCFMYCLQAMKQTCNPSQVLKLRNITKNHHFNKIMSKRHRVSLTPCYKIFIYTRSSSHLTIIHLLSGTAISRDALDFFAEVQQCCDRAKKSLSGDGYAHGQCQIWGFQILDIDMTPPGPRICLL